MKKIQVLDCTLRDGGYINSWRFGKEKINYIISGLIESKVDYIECGYFDHNTDEKECNITRFKNELQLQNTIEEMSSIRKPVAMIDFGKYDIEMLSEQSKSGVYGIRLAFHKYDVDKIKESCKIIKQKGYQLFLQPMVTLNYSDEELVDLVRLANEIEPYAFYIVDSFGSLKKNDLQRMLYLVDHNLKKDIILGFHSHNNLQLAYSNAQVVAQLQTNRQIIIDTSIFGMGRGAGNLNTELFVEFLNDFYMGEYLISPLLRVIDHTLNAIYNEKYWGYSLAYYISAVHNCHPNYATYLSSKNSLFADDIANIISQIDDIHKVHYSEKYAEDQYLNYMVRQKEESINREELSKVFYGQKVILMGPGRSTLEQTDRIKKLTSKEDIVGVSINCSFEELEQDYIFVSNKRRLESIPVSAHKKLIITSNVICEDARFCVLYDELLNEQNEVEDNGGMMLIRLMIELGVKKIYITGIDGFSYDMDENYFMEDLKLPLSKERIRDINYGMRYLINEYKKEVEIEFLQLPKFLLEEI